MFYFGSFVKIARYNSVRLCKYEIIGENKVEGIVLKNTVNLSEIKIQTDGVFPYIGIEPNVEYFSGQLKQDEKQARKILKTE